jgi:hypothetical protein
MLIGVLDLLAKLAKEPNLIAAEDVKVILAGIRRTIGTAPRRKAAATAARVRAMLDACPDSMIGVRDRALLALGFAGAFRRSELIALRVDDLGECPDGFRVLIRRSKTDPGKGQEIVIQRGHKIMPVRAVQAWLQAAGVTDGILGSGRCTGAATCVPGAAGARSDRQTVCPGRDVGPGGVQRAQPAGWLRRPPRPAPASSRSWEATRRKSVDVLAAYVRRVDLFKDHAGAAFL